MRRNSGKVLDAALAGLRALQRRTYRDGPKIPRSGQRTISDGIREAIDYLAARRSWRGWRKTDREEMLQGLERLFEDLRIADLGLGVDRLEEVCAVESDPRTLQGDTTTIGRRGWNVEE